MKNPQTFCDGMSFHRLDIHLLFEQTIQLDAWIGAVLRNNLLYAMEQIRLPDQDITLFRYSQRFLLPEHHSLYNNLKSGFPAPYVIACEPESIYQIGKMYHKGDHLSFSVFLIGEIALYFKEFIHAVKMMCKRGFGRPIKPIILNSVVECSVEGKINTLYIEDEFVSNQLMYPFPFCLERKPQTETSHIHQLAIQLQTPVSLYKLRSKENLEKSYQGKMNGFPSFYQLIRSSVYRLLNLGILYYGLTEKEYHQFLNTLDTFLFKAQKTQLISADIQYIKIQSHPQKGRKDIISFDGYIGKLVFNGNIEPYLPLLKTVESLGIGDAVVYGMGRIKVDIL